MTDNELYQKIKKLTKAGTTAHDISMLINVPFKKVLHFREMRPHKKKQEDGTMKRVIKG